MVTAVRTRRICDEEQARISQPGMPSTRAVCNSLRAISDYIQLLAVWNSANESAWAGL